MLGGWDEADADAMDVQVCPVVITALIPATQVAHMHEHCPQPEGTARAGQGLPVLGLPVLMSPCYAASPMCISWKTPAAMLTGPTERLHRTGGGARGGPGPRGGLRRGDVPAARARVRGPGQPRARGRLVPRRPARRPVLPRGLPGAPETLNPKNTETLHQKRRGLRGLDNRARAAAWSRAALRADPFCHEAFQARPKP